VSSHGVSATEHLSVLLARWLEARLHESIGFCLTGSRLYGLEVIDPDGLDTGEPTAARVSFLAEAADRASTVSHPDARSAGAFDAAALVTVEWRPVGGGSLRPGEFAPRRRARVVELWCGHVGATVIRFENDPEYIVLAPAS